jgi:hypothetical protein
MLAAIQMMEIRALRVSSLNRTTPPPLRFGVADDILF